MATRFRLSTPVVERPLHEWSTIAVELLGAEVQIVHGARWHHRAIHMGQGPALFMYHGIGGHAETFARSLPQIAEAGFHVYAVDALFHGLTSKPDLPDNSVMMQMQVEAVIDLMDALGYASVHYLGESMGAMMGTILGYRCAERVGKMVLNGFGPVRTERPLADFAPSLGNSGGDLWTLSISAVTDPTYDNVAKRIHYLLRDPDRITSEMVRVRQWLYRDREINRAMRQVFGIGQDIRSDFFSLLRHAPTEAELRDAWTRQALVLWSDHNPGLGSEWGEYCADIIGAQFYEFADAGHWPHWEKPDEYSRVVTEFLKA